ncbi:hypothetical protein QUF49_07575 [Fictibacillus sp. b24]|uniref:hypothetical protein n=1 Tax=Fictibacillus sp. b24 TaxID=3055863 RepID=UPI0025A24736|nr:hypothetical protein [Fictibacillus sp. b24]MDM5315853.1 hypothetical protein [Fictibacillus sp. b24]
MGDSCGMSGTGETPQRRVAARGLTARPAESEHLERKSTTFNRLNKKTVKISFT